MAITRREFVYSAMGAAAASAAGANATSASTRPNAAARKEQQARKGPVIIASANGVASCNLAAKLIGEGRGGEAS